MKCQNETVTVELKNGTCALLAAGTFRPSNPPAVSCDVDASADNSQAQS